jgi:hypothetical protein
VVRKMDKKKIGLKTYLYLSLYLLSFSYGAPLAAGADVFPPNPINTNMVTTYGIMDNRCVEIPAPASVPPK